MGASEQAQSDATKLSTETLSLFPQDDNVDLTHASTNDFLRAALNDIATPDERNALTQSDGKINQDGINRVQRALFALAYGDNGLISRMSESTDDNVRGATNALLNAAPTIAKVQAAMENGTLHKYDLSAIADAVKKLSALRDEGKPVQKYLQEQSLFAEHADSAESKEILSFLDKSKHAPNKISTFLKKIASNIQSQGDPHQGNLFGLSDEPKPLMDIIKKARQDVENNGEQDLFAQEEKSEQKSETPKQESKPEESDEQKIDRRAEELLEEVATEGHLPLPKFDTKALAIEIGKNGKGQSAVHIVGKVPNRDAYKRLATELKYLSLKLGGHKDKNEIFDFKSEEDAKVFANALEKYFALTTEEKQSRISAGEEKAKAQAEKNKADLEKRVSQISDEEKQAQAQKILNALDRGVLTLNEAISNVENIINPKKPNKRNKHSKQDNVDTRIDNIVADEDLTPQQKLLQTFGKKLGVKVKFFSNEDGDFHGAHKSGTSYINVNSKMPIGKVFWHESMHWLKANNPKLYQSLVKAAGITDAQRQAYLEQTGRDDLETDEEIDEEIIADQFEDVAKRTGLLQSISGKNRSLIDRVVQWLKDTMNKFIDHFKNPDGKLTTNQSIALADEFGRIAKDLVDPNGDKIFRYNRRTHNIELADGRGLNDEIQTKKALAELAKAAWNDKNFNGKVSFTPSKKFRDKAQELFGHDIDTVFITGSDIRHIKGHHGTGEDARGQVDMTPDSIADIYDTVNDFSSARRERDDNKGNKTISVVSKDGLG
ncbi:MAG: hypothetical protein IJQ82_05210, partial [Selenomonadaceae bacterium]|nr:hypothetical protein [Selenomonadaceae bacterium]